MPEPVSDVRILTFDGRALRLVRPPDRFCVQESGNLARVDGARSVP